MKRSESRKKAAEQRQQQIRSKAFVRPPDGQPPRFVADVMLGRLAKWLRIAGFDVLYSNRFTDDELVQLSRRQGRILLSRDTRLLVRKAVERFIFLESEKIQEQLAQVFRATRTSGLPGILTRCLSCNDLLQEIARDHVRDRVPPFVFKTQAQFKSCPVCARIYWAGTHRQSVLRTLENRGRTDARQA
jgi:uncharacterized protein with PIN domain